MQVEIDLYNLVNELRRKHGSIAAGARAAGVSQSYLNDIATKKRDPANAREDFVRKILKALGRDYDRELLARMKNKELAHKGRIPLDVYESLADWLRAMPAKQSDAWLEIARQAGFR